MDYFLKNEIGLEEPLQGRSIFIKEIDDIKEVLPFITQKIQAISIGINDSSKKNTNLQKLPLIMGQIE